MYKSNPHPQTNMNLRIAISQKQALKRTARQRGVTVQHLIRQGIAAMTGEPDPIAKFKPPTP
jgi:predicted DNA binding CopG/RHH family protein